MCQSESVECQLSASCKLITSKDRHIHIHTDTHTNHSHFEVLTGYRGEETQPRYPSRHLSLLSAKQQWPLNYVCGSSVIYNSLPLSLFFCLPLILFPSVCECLSSLMFAWHFCFGRDTCWAVSTAASALAKVGKFFFKLLPFCRLAFDLTFDAIIRTHTELVYSNIAKVLPGRPYSHIQSVQQDVNFNLNGLLALQLLLSNSTFLLSLNCHTRRP